MKRMTTSEQARADAMAEDEEQHGEFCGNCGGYIGPCNPAIASLLEAIGRIINLSQHPYFPTTVAKDLPAWDRAIEDAKAARAAFRAVPGLRG